MESGVREWWRSLRNAVEGVLNVIASSLQFLWKHKWKIIAWSLLLFFVAIALWVSAVVLYALLYYSYMPIVHTQVPLHFDFR